MPQQDNNTIKAQDRLKNRRSGVIVYIKAGPEEIRMTSWGKDIVIADGEAAGTYKAVAMIHYEEVKRSLTLEGSSLSLTVPINGAWLQSRLAGNPNIRLEVKVWEVVKADLLGNATGEDIRRIWSGNGKGISIGKTQASLSVISQLDVETTLGTMVYQSQDQTNPIDIIDDDLLKVETVINGKGPNRESWVVVQHVEPFAGYYEAGILIYGTDRIRIASSKIEPGLGTKLQLQYTPGRLAISDDVTIFPGYNGNLKTARTKFPDKAESIVANFRGFPYIPAINPATAGV